MRKKCPNSSSLKKKWILNKVLRYYILLWLKAIYLESDYGWAQDGALSYTMNQVQKFYNDNFANFWPVNF